MGIDVGATPTGDKLEKKPISWVNLAVGAGKKKILLYISFFFNPLSLINVFLNDKIEICFYKPPSFSRYNRNYHKP